MVNAEAFERFVAVQKSGVTNMMDARVVCELAELTRQQHSYIIEHYSELLAELESQKCLEYAEKATKNEKR